MVFDTTSSNTGCKRGACRVLQNELGVDLVGFACRHHICEVVVSDVFFTCFGKATSGPEVMLFKRFKMFWPSIRREDVSSSREEIKLEMNLDGSLKVFKEDAISFAREIEKSKKIRDDYREFIELSLIFLGEVPVRGSKVRAPGAMHHARWMAKILYCFKIFFFRKQFPLRRSELSAIVKFNLFTSLIYMKMWFQAPIAISAPENDISSLKIIHEYKKHDLEVAEAAMKALLRHLWYLSDDIAGICLFSDNMSVLEKVEVLQAMGNIPKPKKEKAELGKREIEHLKLADFVSSRSKELIGKLLPNLKFLSKNPSEWPEDPEYQLAKRRAKALCVVNDLAERGVAYSRFQSFSHKERK